MKKIYLLLTIIAIIYLSNVPKLVVSQPESWINEPEYETKINYTHFLNKESEFFLPYKDIANKEFILHKIGHIVFYSLLTYLVYINLKKRKRDLFYAWVFITFFGLTDEMHQAYIVGRSGRIMDVYLDSASGLFMIIAIIIYSKFKNKT